MHAYIIGFHQGERDMVDTAEIAENQYKAIEAMMNRYKPEIRKTVGIAKITLFSLRPALVRRHRYINSTNTVTQFRAKVAIGQGWLMYVREDDGSTFLNRCMTTRNGNSVDCTIARDDHKIIFD